MFVLQRRVLCPAALAVALLAGAGAPASAQDVVIDGIAAQVGTDVVLISEVSRLSDPLVAQMRSQGATERDVAILQADVLERLIERQLVENVARRAEIDASDTEVDEAIAAIASENGISVDVLRSSVESQGMSFAAYRRNLSDQILQEKVVAGMVRPKVHLDESELKLRFDERFAEQPTGGIELWLHNLLIPARDEKPASLTNACAATRQAMKRIQRGESLVVVASEVSPVRPDLGFVYRDSLAPWMLEVVDRLEPGERSPVIELPFGCAVLELVERREFVPITYEEAKAALQQELYEEKFQTEYKAFLEQLRNQTYIERKGIFAEAARLDVASPPSDEATDEE